MGSPNKTLESLEETFVAGPAYLPVVSGIVGSLGVDVCEAVRVGCWSVKGLGAIIIQHFVRR